MLRLLLGDEALWIPIRLWAYCAENQPDGDISKYTSEQLSMLLGCSSNAQALLGALKSSGFVESDGKIHDWHEHNGYHSAFADRARKAARARWDKEKSPTPPKEGNRKGESGDKQCSSIATSIQNGERLNLILTPDDPLEIKIETLNPEQLKLRRIFRKHSTKPFNGKELTSWRKITPIPTDELLAVERYYGTKESAGNKIYKMKSLITLLNRWDEAVDWALNFKPHSIL